ncbi:TatD family hydrolase, partial [Candidatus Roizmanbacteria bacterium]|nr:TatD family hydrolase [Candidatus Roizmanbacteria bacterium]
MFDTHCHLNFKAFSTTGRSPFGRDDRVEEVINNAKKVGVNYFVVPGTDIDTSKKAVEIAKKYDGVYAAVGIHPHHIYLYQTSNFKYQKDRFNIKNKTMSHPGFISPRLTRFQDRLSKKQMLNQVQHDILRIEKLLTNPRVVAVGEVGVDRHYYNKTKYADYRIDESFIGLQKEFLRRQIELAIKYDKSLILHNREAKKDLLDILLEVWSEKLEGKTVFHCCEPDFVETGHAPSLLHFAKKHNIYIGVDGDVTYW